MACGNCGPQMVMSGYGGYGTNVSLNPNQPTVGQVNKYMTPFMPIGYGAARRGVATTMGPMSPCSDPSMRTIMSDNEAEWRGYQYAAENILRKMGFRTTSKLLPSGEGQRRGKYFVVIGGTEYTYATGWSGLTDRPSGFYGTVDARNACLAAEQYRRSHPVSPASSRRRGAFRGYQGIPLTPEEYDAMIATLPPEPTSDTTVGELETSLNDYFTGMTNAFANSDFPLDGTWPEDRQAVMNAALITAFGENYIDVLASMSPDELQAALGVPRDFAEGFMGAIATIAPPKPKKKCMWPWYVGIVATGVVAATITYAATR